MHDQGVCTEGSPTVPRRSIYLPPFTICQQAPHENVSRRASMAARSAKSMRVGEGRGETPVILGSLRLSDVYAKNWTDM